MNSKGKMGGQFKMALEYYRPPSRIWAWLRRWFWIPIQWDKGAITVPVVLLIVAAHVGVALWIFCGTKPFENQQESKTIWIFQETESLENHKLIEVEDLANYLLKLATEKNKEID